MYPWMGAVSKKEVEQNGWFFLLAFFFLPVALYLVPYDYKKIVHPSSTLSVPDFMFLRLPCRSAFCLLAGFVMSSFSPLLGQSLGINGTGAAPDPSAALDVSASGQGVLIPRIALTATNAAEPVTAPATSLLVYNIATAGTPPHDVQPGYYYWNGTLWTRLANANGTTTHAWSQAGNASTDPSVHFVGTTDARPLVLKTNAQRVAWLPAHVDSSLFVGYQAGVGSTGGIQNMALGNQALSANFTGYLNTAVGLKAMTANIHGHSGVALGAYALWKNTTGYHNTALGAYTLWDNTSGYYNTAAGIEALYKNTTGARNTAVGRQALFSNTTGLSNVALGAGALYSNTVQSNLVAIGDGALYKNGQGVNADQAFDNVAVGYVALYNNTFGSGNTAVGNYSLHTNSTGVSNTALGAHALRNNTTGAANIAVGNTALAANTSGGSNSALGNSALAGNTTGYSNSAFGNLSLLSNTNGNNNTALGAESLFTNTTGGSNTGVGFQSLRQTTWGSGNSALGAMALFNNTSGGSNAAVGGGALYSNTTGSSNTALGTSALYYNSWGGYNTAVGNFALNSNVTGSYNTGVGNMAGPVYGNFENTGAFGYSARPTASNYYHIGNTAVTSIGGQVGWSTYSDQRFKVDVRENVSGLDFILKLRPVTYRWDIDSLNRFLYGPAADTLFASPAARGGISGQEGITYTGFLAQEVEAAAQSSGFDFSGVSAPANARTPYSIRYAEFVVPLVKAVQEQQAQLGQQTQLLASLAARQDRPVVQLSSANAWADRVFAPGYRLRPLSEVERYVRQHHHLPGIPSAQTLAKQGVDVATMLASQMEKIEELTLYVVELEKKNEELTQKYNELEALKSLVQELQKRMEKN